MKSKTLASTLKMFCVAADNSCPSFDLALPTECDDEYWLTADEDPLFKQPPGKPSKVSGFVYSLRLGQILAFVNRTIVSDRIPIRVEILALTSKPVSPLSMRRTSQERSSATPTSGGNNVSSPNSTRH